MTGDRLYKKCNRLAKKREQARLRMLHVQQPKDIADKICFSLMSPALAHKLYRLMQIVHEIFTELDITYWADGGTLLGVVRNGGILATDDDLDVCIFEKDVHKLYAEVSKKLQERGCKILPIAGVCEKIFFAEDVIKTVDPKTGVVSHKAPLVGLDVFPVQETRGYTYVHTVANKAWSSTYFYKAPQLLPLCLMPFGPLMIWVPYDPHTYLDRAYPDWNKGLYFNSPQTPRSGTFYRAS